MKSNYKDYPKMHLGNSDIFSLTVRFLNSTKPLNFGIEGPYGAYIVDENAEIPDYYSLIWSGRRWVRIYDDKELTFSAAADVILIYRSGNRGCVIQLINSKCVNGKELKRNDEEMDNELI